MFSFIFGLVLGAIIAACLIAYVREKREEQEALSTGRIGFNRVAIEARTKGEDMK